MDGSNDFKNMLMSEWIKYKMLINIYEMYCLGIPILKR